MPAAAAFFKAIQAQNDAKLQEATTRWEFDFQKPALMDTTSVQTVPMTAENAD